MILQVGVKVFLKNREGRYLILRRSPSKYPNIERYWDIPGGRILPGTPLATNLEREVFEETKLRVLTDPKLIYAQDIIRLPEKHIVRLTFVSSTEGEPTLDEEHNEFRWVTLEEMRNMEKLDEFTLEVLGRNIL